jgi:hypothetical protein
MIDREPRFIEMRRNANFRLPHRRKTSRSAGPFDPTFGRAALAKLAPAHPRRELEREPGPWALRQEFRTLFARLPPNRVGRPTRASPASRLARCSIEQLLGIDGMRFKQGAHREERKRSANRKSRRCVPARVARVVCRATVRESVSHARRLSGHGVPSFPLDDRTTLAICWDRSQAR